MPGLAKKPQRKIEPLDWKEAAQSPALKGMMSFLDISPEAIRRGHYPDIPPGLTGTMQPVDNSSPADAMYPIEAASPVDHPDPVVITSPMVTSSTGDAETPIDTKSSIDEPTPAAVLAPVDRSSSGQIVRTAGMVAGEVPTLNRKIIRCRLAQDGHTHAEETVYKTLWEDTTPADRTVRMGYAELAARTRLSRKTVGRLLQSLKAKLAIETLDEHRSMDLVPKNYRVYSYKEILDRRREAGMEYVIRMNGIVFVSADGVPLKPEGEGKQGREATSRSVDKTSPVDTSSPGDIASVSEQLNRYWTVDEDAAVQLVRSCRTVRPDAALDEIAFFVQEKVALVHANRSITNPTGFVLATVPQCFAGDTFLRFRARRDESLRIAAEEKERQGREAQEMIDYFRKKAQAVLDNPASTDIQRRQAEKELRAYNGFQERKG